ncbi:hypothetical protein ACTFIR_004326 [Dictyostelium discoideum]
MINKSFLFISILLVLNNSKIINSTSSSCPAGTNNMANGGCPTVMYPDLYCECDSDGKCFACLDIDECISGHDCVAPAACVNDYATFICKCPLNGYTPNGTGCDDIDECSLGSHDCVTPANCVNNVGSFACQCPFGYKLSSNSKSCDDVDECTATPTICGSATCVNTQGSYKCICQEGYIYSPTASGCVDIDECANPSVCGSAICNNSPGSFFCQCPNGYSYNSTSQACDDVNECIDTPTVCGSAKCTNTDGNYICSCDIGLSYDSSTKSCLDDNECSMGTHNCVSPATCVNTHASFTCECINQPGYTLSNNGTNCIDIDECSLDTDDCISPAYCVNAPAGSFTCACNDGYTLSGDAKSCTDIDECSSSTHTHDCVSPATCINNDGSFSCVCKDIPGYSLSSNGKSCSKTNISISSVIPSFTNGGEASFIGVFGNTFKDLSLLISSNNCSIIANSSNLIKCAAPPGQGVHSVTLNIDGEQYIANQIYQYQNQILQCPNDCLSKLNQGICDSKTGQCKCNTGFNSYDCSGIILDDTKSNGGIIKFDNHTNSFTTNDNNVKFLIYYKQLKEVGFDGQVYKSYPLKKEWILNSTFENEMIFEQSISHDSNCKIITHFQEIKDEKKSFQFANEQFYLEKGSIKVTIKVTKYDYINNLNTLELELISSIEEQDQNGDDCNSKDIDIEDINSPESSKFSFIKISKDNKIFSGRFLNKLLSDNRETFFSTENIKDLESNSITTLLKLPHFNNECIIDPDFSVLLSTDFKENCKEDNNRKWVIPVSIVIPVVFVASAIIIFSIIYKKSTTVKITLKKFKSIKLNSMKG